MNRFSFARASDVSQAIQQHRSNGAAAFIAGGTNLVDLWRENVAHPQLVIDINGLPLRQIEPTATGGLKIGALVTNSAAAYDATIGARYPLLAKAILAGASPQIRNVASVGGNLLQRTRCLYFYDAGTRCNKREPGTGCPAMEGVNRMHAILGASEHCIAVHPSDMCVALAALDATVHLCGPEGSRVLPFAEFHRLPGDTPHLDTNVREDELITAVELPKQGFAEHHAYVKVRDRASYAFALVSVALGLELDGDKIVNAHCALGGVAHKPWRNADAEASLRGKPLTVDTVRDFATDLLREARGRRGNAFKIELTARAIERAFAMAAQRSLEDPTR
ncbi:FAD binding domain-containing protein [Paraburkholderia phenoliruptrix]|uniref:Aldehyde oxidoreductase FAD-binding subunit PaoB n=1 Tax=Paraburkholderia phenoliruptrix TaxID=252970 RepID=A0A6J5AIR1_9BURK|nr:xanthine dehydrogenase family protein subunit M [Paraburkholderia phenoliruptrix]WMY12537.1 xanthine dehydrogenase family protein subunit M [Paraburkholderia phenoliruptrix]CAB3669620.1 Aldehyde oxidoreductase FAD-binding subunit PaoB [Paraburkholderia phenoliruptrix]